MSLHLDSLPLQRLRVFSGPGRGQASLPPQAAVLVLLAAPAWTRVVAAGAIVPRPVHGGDIHPVEPRGKCEARFVERYKGGQTNTPCARAPKRLATRFLPFAVRATRIGSLPANARAGAHNQSAKAASVANNSIPARYTSTFRAGSRLRHCW